MLSKAQILQLFQELDDELGKTQTRGDVFVVGGAAMAVAYDARPATRDVDAIFHPSLEVRLAAARVAASHDDITEDWLNDGVKGFLPGNDAGKQVVLHEGNYLTVRSASPEYLLATKLLASRISRDEDDILFLYRLCGLSTVNDGLDLLERYYGNRPIEAKVRFLLEEILNGQM
jgi:hypothetical protein